MPPRHPATAWPTFRPAKTIRSRREYPYALSKYQGEQAVLHWHKVYRLPVNSIRIFNAYGPRVAHHRRLWRGVRRFLQAEAGRQAVHRGRRRHAEARFSLRHRRRRGFLRAAESDFTGEVWNLGAGNPQAVNRLVELLGGPVVYIPKRPGEPDCTWADIGKIQRDLGWKPVVPFEQGVRRMMQDIDLWRDAPLWDPQSIADATKTWFQYLGREA